MNSQIKEIKFATLIRMPIYKRTECLLLRGFFAFKYRNLQYSAMYMNIKLKPVQKAIINAKCEFSNKENAILFKTPCSQEKAVYFFKIN